jgi:thiol-disulfide isomerase/thioredoxin
MKKLILLSALLTIAKNVFCQIAPLKTGDVLPDISLENVYNYKNEVLRLSDIKNKTIVIEFWSTRCGSCLKQYPKLAKLQAQFRDDLLIIMSTKETKEAVDKFFAKRDELKKLNIVTAYEESYLDSLFPNDGVPYYAWIGKDRIVRALTSSTELTESNIQKLINKDNISLVRAKKTEVDREEFLFYESNASKESVVFSSLLTDSIKNGALTRAILNITDRKRKIVCINTPLFFLYSFAYRQEIQLAHGITSQIVFNSRRFDIDTKFCYELLFPKQIYTDRQAFKIMQSEIDRGLGLKSEVIRKRSKVYVVQIIDSSKAISSSEREIIEHVDHTELKNIDFDRLGFSLANNVPSNLPIVCDGKASVKVSLKIMKAYKDLKSMQTALSEYGFHVFIAERDIDLLVISDAEKK